MQKFGIEKNSKVLPVFTSIFFQCLYNFNFISEVLVANRCFGVTNVDQLAYKIDLTIVNSQTLVSQTSVN